MGRQLAATAKAFFQKVPGATIRHGPGTLVCTATPAQIEEAMKGDLLWQALAMLDAKQTPCWQCSKQSTFKLFQSDWGGKIESGPAGQVARTLHDESGACIYCHHVNTKRQLAIMARRQQANIEKSRRRLEERIDG